MKVRIVKDADLPTHRLTKGMVLVVDDKYAVEWLDAGIAELAPLVPKRRTAKKTPSRETRDAD